VSRDLVRPYLIPGKPLGLPASADATLAKIFGACSSAGTALFQAFSRRKMLTPALTYINCDAKPPRS
jgi:hypothetical protein